MKSLIVRLEWRYNRRHYEGGQQMESRWYRNTIVTKVTIAIAIITIVIERDVGIVAAQL